MKKVKEGWLKGLTEAEIEKMRGDFATGLPLRQRLDYMLECKLDKSFKAQQLRANYDRGDWALEQADAIGYARALNAVRYLLDVGYAEGVKRGKGRPSLDDVYPQKTNI